MYIATTTDLNNDGMNAISIQFANTRFANDFMPMLFSGTEIMWDGRPPVPCYEAGPKTLNWVYNDLSELLWDDSVDEMLNHALYWASQGQIEHMVIYTRRFSYMF